MQTPPGQFHESPTEQYWNSLPADQTALTAGAMQTNTNQFSQNCNINNNITASGDYDGTRMDYGGEWS